jgi:predicted lipoprotein with Yx(FWY)xxD motif
MRIPKLLFAAAAIPLAGCDTIPPAPVPVVPVPAAATSLTTAVKAPFGTYLVDANGRAVYILDGTRGQNPAYRCAGECLGHWPPMLTAGLPVAAAGVTPAAIATIPAYGGAQATYAGWPLFYYHMDVAHGDTTGQGVHDTWGAWYLLSHLGEPIRPAGGY